MMPWFSEPTCENSTLLKNGQAYFDWVSTSTLPRAKAARDFLNFNLNCLPLEVQKNLYSKLQKQWKSTFFEIVVGRTLQALGANLIFEQEIPSGRTPDWHAEFTNQKIIAEAVSPEINQNEIRQQTISLNRLEDFIEAHTPEGYSVSILTLPDISGSSSLKPYKTILTKLLHRDISHESNSHTFSQETKLGRFELTLLRREPGWPIIVARFGGTYLNDAIRKIQELLKKKKKQVESSEHLRILAIHGDSQCTQSDLDQALFGHNLVHATGKVEFIADGKFGKQNSFDGVLFFEQIGFSCPNEPILFKHPQSTRTVPQELEIFRQRIMVNRKEIKEIEPKNVNIMAALMPVNLLGL